ncbi:GIY-YIG nuclease family protein [Cronobacter sakazakii]|nr:GIY-YIG nuclease family protein [Cronobacter sakazakii]
MSQQFNEYQVLDDMKVPDAYRQNGFVYVLENSCMPGLYKVGMTTNNPDARAKELSGSTGVPEPFKLVAAFHSRSPKSDERLIHDAFAAERVSDKREFFKLGRGELETLLSELESLVGPERNASCAELAMRYSLISFSCEEDVDLESELSDAGLNGFLGEERSARNFLIRIGISHLKEITKQTGGSVVIDHDGSVNIVKDAYIQWEERNHEQ